MLGPESPISDIELSPEERKALRGLKIATVGDFLRLDLKRVYGLWGCGAYVYARLKKTRENLREIVPGGEAPAAGPPKESRARATALDAPGGKAAQADDELRSLGLSRRSLKTLRLLKVRTADEFLTLDLDGPCGRTARCSADDLRHLAKVQARFRRRIDLESAESAPAAGRAAGGFSSAATTQAFARQPAAPGSWVKLPLFSNHPMPGVSPGDLHVSYRADVPVEHLAMTTHVRRVVAEKQIVTLGQLLLTPGSSLLGENCLKGILTRIRSLVGDFLTHSIHGPPPVEIDFRTPERFLTSLLEPVLRNQRQRQVLLGRVGWPAKPRTLQELSEEIGLTRERIRQIEQAALGRLQHWQSAGVLRPLYEMIGAMLRDISPVMSLRAISQSLQERHGWTEPLGEEVVAMFLRAFPQLKVVQGRYVCADDFRCGECPSLPQALESALAAAAVEEIGLSPLARRLRAEMSSREACRQCGRPAGRASLDLVRLAIERSAATTRRYRLVKNKLWSLEHWRICQGTLATALDAILKSHAGPMSCRELHAAAKRLRGGKITLEMVRHSLAFAATRRREILLWNRGGVYQHKTHVNLDTPLLQTIEERLIESLRAGLFPQMSTYAAFQEFAGQCRAAGLASEYAIHSCLKHRQHPALAFLHAPYVVLAGGPKNRTPNLPIVEELIRRAGGPIKYDALKQTVCGRMGLKKFQFKGIVSQLGNVIRTQKGFLHVEHFDAGSTVFSALLKYVERKLAGEGPLSANAIYAEKKSACRQLRIDGPRMLHSVLLRYGSRVFSKNAYPVLAARAAEDAGE